MARQRHAPERAGAQHPPHLEILQLAALQAHKVGLLQVAKGERSGGEAVEGGRCSAAGSCRRGRGWARARTAFASAAGLWHAPPRLPLYAPRRPCAVVAGTPAAGWAPHCRGPCCVPPLPPAGRGRGTPWVDCNRKARPPCAPAIAPWRSQQERKARRGLHREAEQRRQRAPGQRGALRAARLSPLSFGPRDQSFLCMTGRVKSERAGAGLGGRWAPPLRAQRA